MPLLFYQHHPSRMVVSARGSKGWMRRWWFNRATNGKMSENLPNFSIIICGRGGAVWAAPRWVVRFILRWFGSTFGQSIRSGVRSFEGEGRLEPWPWGEVRGTAATQFRRKYPRSCHYGRSFFIYAVGHVGARKDLRMAPIDATANHWRIVGWWETSEDRDFGEEVPSDDELHPKARWPLTTTRKAISHDHPALGCCLG